MADQISNVQANAFIVSTTTNREDFQDSKKLFKESLQEALQNASDKAKVQVYQEAVRGFLLELGQDADSTQAYIKRIQRSTEKLKALQKRHETKVKPLVVRLANILWKPLAMLSIGGAIAMFIAEAMKLFK